MTASDEWSRRQGQQQPPWSNDQGQPVQQPPAASDSTQPAMPPINHPQAQFAHPNSAASQQPGAAPAQQQPYDAYQQASQQVQPGFAAPQASPQANSGPGYAQQPAGNVPHDPQFAQQQPAAQQFDPAAGQQGVGYPQGGDGQPQQAYQQSQSLTQQGYAEPADFSVPQTTPPSQPAFSPAPEPLTTQSGYTQAPAPGLETDYANTAYAPQTADANAFGGQQQAAGFDAVPTTSDPNARYDLPEQQPYGYDVGSYAGTAPSGAPEPTFGAAQYAENIPVDPQPSFQPPPMAQTQGSLEAVSATPDYDAQYGDDDEYDDYEEPPRRRSFVIVGALVGAIAIGGGLAYGYKSFLTGGGASSGAPKVVRSGTSPSKVKPDSPGGKQFANRGTKVLGRLNKQEAASGARSASGAKTVSTFSVGRDGRLSGGGTTNSRAASKPASTTSGTSDFSGIPGVSVVDAFAGAPQPQGRSQQKPATQQRKPVETLRVRNSANPSRNAAPKPPARPVRIAEAKPSRTAPVKTKPTPSRLGGTQNPPQRVAARTPPKPSKTVGGVSRNGYVAVLASVPVSSKSRVNALTQFASLRQKYSSVLASKQPDVVEANLGQRGKYHRLLVGPPGSRSAASRVCSQLKAAGFSGCWVTAY